MTTQLTDSEKRLLTDTITAAGAITILLDPGIVASPKAFLAASLAVKDGLNAVAELPILGELRVALEPGASPPEPGLTEDRFFGMLKESIAVLDTKGATPDVRQAFRRLVVDTARATAEASGSPLFGSASPAAINEKERAFLARIDQALPS